MADKPWQPQLPGGGNNIPDSYLRAWEKRWRKQASEPLDEQPEPEDESLARFLRDEL